MRIKISVIVPTFNYGSFIKEAIESVLDQTCPAAEIIVVDDGSTDDTGRVVEYFGERVRYLKQTNAGVSAARNAGIEVSSGDLIAFLDADDTWLPEKIEKQVARFVEDDQIGLVHCGLREFDNVTGETIAMYLEGGEGWVAEELALRENPIISGPGGSIIVKRRVFDDVGRFDTRLKVGEDWEFCLRVAMKFKVGFVREPLVNCRNHGNNAHLDVKEMERSAMIAWKRAFDFNDEKMWKLRRRSYANLHKVLAGSYLHDRHYFGFVRHVFLSLWYRPAFFAFYFNSLRGANPTIPK